MVLKSLMLIKAIQFTPQKKLKVFLKSAATMNSHVMLLAMAVEQLIGALVVEVRVLVILMMKIGKTHSTNSIT
jgi:hypothetical protein